MKNTILHTRIDGDVYEDILLLTTFKNGSPTVAHFVRTAIDLYIELEKKKYGI
jgi:hypothetical protein